jgi:hypothetical protein
MILLIGAYVVHFFEGALGDLGKRIIEGPTLPMLILLYVALIVSRLELIADSFNERLRALEENRLLEMSRGLDTVLRKVLGRYLDDAVSNLSSAVQRREMAFNDTTALPFLYRNLVSAFPGHAFCAVTTPSKWTGRNEEVYQCMRSFIRLSNGTIRRVFVVERELTADDKRVINAHLSAGVIAAQIFQHQIEPNDLQNFLVERTGAFGWRTVQGMMKGQERLVATSNPAETRKLLEAFDRIWAHSVEIHSPFMT